MCFSLFYAVNNFLSFVRNLQYKDSPFSLFDRESDGVFVVTGHHHCDPSLASVVDLGHYFLHNAVVAMGGGVKGRLDRILVTNGGSSLSLLQYRDRH